MGEMIDADDLTTKDIVPIVQDQGVSERASLGSWVVPLILLGLSIAIAALRLRTYNEPLEPDLITYMLFSHALNRGGQLYVDTWILKPPGIYLIYALAERVAGFGELQVYLLNVGAAVVTLVGVYVAGATRGRIAGLWAAAFWTLLCGAPTLWANQPNTEVFINACAVWALALLLRGFGHSRSVVPAVAVGALFAVGSIIKQTIIVDAIFLSCVHVALAAGLPGGRRRALRDVAIMAAVGAACWALLIGYFAATGRFEIFWVTNFRIARAYAGNPLFNLYRYVREAKFLPRLLWLAIPVGALVLLGALRDRRALWERHWAMFLAALISLQIKIATNGTAFLPHYYQYWLPMLAIGAGWATGAKMPRRGSFPSWVMPAAGAVVACFLLVDQGRYHLLPADEWSRHKYGASVVEGRDLGRAIRDVLRPEEGLYVHGDCPGLYYYSDHRPPSPVLWTMHLNDTWPLAELTLRRHLSALTTDPPDLLIVEQPPDVSGQALKPKKAGLIGRLFARGMKVNEGRNARTVLNTLLPDYHPAKIEALRGFSSFRLYILSGGALDRRLNRGATQGL